MHKTRLIIAPHIDDEVLGCYTAISEDCHILYCGYDESKINYDWVRKRPSVEVRLQELTDLQERLNFSYETLNNRVNYYTVQDLIPEFERVFNKVTPVELYIPVPSYNQDHRAVYEAALTALRPHDINYFVPRVLLYEQVQDLWNHNYHTFKPVWFKALDIEKKISAYQVLRTQVRNFRSPAMISNLAALRGIQSSRPYAEAFEILRWID